MAKIPCAVQYILVAYLFCIWQLVSLNPIPKSATYLNLRLVATFRKSHIVRNCQHLIFRGFALFCLAECISSQVRDHSCLLS